MCKPFIEIDYPCVNLWYEFYEERQGWSFPFTPVNVKPINDTDMEDPRIVDILEAMGIIKVFKRQHQQLRARALMSTPHS